MAPIPRRVPTTDAISSIGRLLLMEALAVVHCAPDDLIDRVEHHELLSRGQGDQGIRGRFDHLDQVAVQNELAPVQPFQSDHVRSIMEWLCVTQAPHSSMCAATVLLAFQRGWAHVPE